MRRRKTFQAHREGTTRGRTSDTGNTNKEGTGDDACKHSGSEKAASSGQGGGRTQQEVANSGHQYTALLIFLGCLSW